MSKFEGQLAEHGKTLIENGYAIIPIPVGSKSPGFDGWQNTKATPNLVKQWVENGHRDSGVGILTKNNPAVDLDILDEEVAKMMEDWCLLNIGDAPVRVGKFPKRILVFRTEEPFSKMKTGKYEDEWGDKHEIEILGNGQQFIAYGIHKDTGREYQWTSDTQPTSLHVENLTLITPDDCKALMAYFVKVATERGWKKVTNGLSGNVRPIDAEDDAFADVETTVDIPIDELRLRLMSIPGSDDHDRWVQIGMALFHQFGGDDDGLALWHEWSETADNYDAEELDKRWKSFQIEGKKRAPVTARTILKMAKEAATTMAVEKVNELRDKFIAAKDEIQWREACRDARRAEIDQLARAHLVEVAKKRYHEISGIKMSVAVVRKELEYEIQTGKKTPSWCKGWVFDGQNDTFFHLQSKTTLSITGFNAVYARNAMTRQDIAEGKVSPSHNPAELALNMYNIPIVHGKMYCPGKDPVFENDGVQIANLYAEHKIPETPAELLPIHKVAIRTVKNHIAHLLEDEWEQRLFLNWLAWLVQNPGKRVNWGMLLQGVEGDGKSFFAYLLRKVMGEPNVRMLTANVLEGDFTGWAHGQCVLVVEEPRLQGHNKYDVINKIKPLITNPIISVHAKGRDPFDAENTTNYYLPTNFRDALPLNDNDRRYCVLFSRWQQRDQLREFVNDNPDYYKNLYAAVENHFAALRKWLLDHQIDDDFPAGGDAPMTKAHGYMVAASTPETIQVINEIIAENKHYDISEHILNATTLPDAMIGRDTELPQTNGIKRLLEHNGYVALGRVKISHNNWGRFWSKVPHMFRVDGYISNDKIREYLKHRKSEMEDNDL